MLEVLSSTRIISELFSGYFTKIQRFITSCKEDLSVKRHLEVTNVSSHWYYFIHTDQSILMH